MIINNISNYIKLMACSLLMATCFTLHGQPGDCAPNSTSDIPQTVESLQDIDPIQLCNNTSQFLDSDLCNDGNYYWYRLDLEEPSDITLNFSQACDGGPTGGFYTCSIYEINDLNSTFISPSSSNAGTLHINTLPAGSYWIVVYIEDICGYLNFTFSDDPCIDFCESCIGSFSPEPESKYLLSAWAMEETATADITHYNDPEILITFYNVSGPIGTIGPFLTSGSIIDGWQRIEEEFIVPIDAIRLSISLQTQGVDVLFDDIRVLPFDGSMKSYVYDPINMRLAAELDERHYATFYEYDEEGNLVRVKKETEKGIMTIKESKSNTSKQ